MPLSKTDRRRITAFSKKVYKTRGTYKDLYAIHSIGLKELQKTIKKFNNAKSEKSKEKYRKEIKIIVPALKRVKKKMLLARKRRITALYGKSRVSKRTGKYKAVPRSRYRLKKYRKRRGSKRYSGSKRSGRPRSKRRGSKRG